ncbi:GNAT family N-acetyltransferase [Ekhidna sp.]|uniref:GNAT family N-acetyltransferase n=1 Tax=Ekhidna sp. TaxID=2608089 RepID=UPI003296D121
MRHYEALNKQVYSNDNYSIVPIREEDRYEIMNWRNEQIYHLRQSEPLTTEKQDHYFSNIISDLFKAENPNQILFSFMKGEKCIGYGGLVHINWIDKNAEISFIMDTKLENSEFRINWEQYLKLIEKVAFKDLAFNKIFVYAFDLRPHLYDVLEQQDFFLDARLKDHCFFENTFIDVVIYSKLNGQ